MPTVLERIRKLNHIVRWLEKEILATGGAQGYDSVCTQVKEDAACLKEVTLTDLEDMSPPVRVEHLPHCLLCYRAELWTLHQRVNVTSSRAEAARALNAPWSPQPRQALALTHVADMPLLYRRISSGGVMTIFGQKYTERY
jgi:hypothetical protein